MSRSTRGFALKMRMKSPNLNASIAVTRTIALSSGGTRRHALGIRIKPPDLHRPNRLAKMAIRTLGFPHKMPRHLRASGLSSSLHIPSEGKRSRRLKPRDLFASDSSQIQPISTFTGRTIRSRPRTARWVVSMQRGRTRTYETSAILS